MDFGAIIKRSWQITWRHKALWVLGIFAGVSGCTGGTGGSSPGGSGQGVGGDMGAGTHEFARVWESVQAWIPLMVGVFVLLVFAGILWWVFAIAARGGLIAGVNSIEEGHEQQLGALWRAGFVRFWSLVGVDIVLALPLIVVGVVMTVIVLVPVIGAISAGGRPGFAMLAPMCGSLALGVPLLLVGGFVLGIMRLIAQRYVMLGGQGAIEATGNSWRFFRARFKDSALMYLVNFALNVASSIVLAVPVIAIGVALAVPLATAVVSREWGVVAAALPIGILAFTLLGLAYNAVWGTYTSTLWTIFFRQVSGMTAAEQGPPPPPVAGYGDSAATPPPPPAPPIAGYGDSAAAAPPAPPPPSDG